MKGFRAFHLLFCRGIFPHSPPECVRVSAVGAKKLLQIGNQFSFALHTRKKQDGKKVCNPPKLPPGITEARQLDGYDKPQLYISFCISQLLRRFTPSRSLRFSRFSSSRMRCVIYSLIDISRLVALSFASLWNRFSMDTLVTSFMLASYTSSNKDETFQRFF